MSNALDDTIALCRDTPASMLPGPFTMSSSGALQGAQYFTTTAIAERLIDRIEKVYAEEKTNCYAFALPLEPRSPASDDRRKRPLQETPSHRLGRLVQHASQEIRASFPKPLHVDHLRGGTLICGSALRAATARRSSARSITHRVPETMASIS